MSKLLTFIAHKLYSFTHQYDTPALQQARQASTEARRQKLWLKNMGINSIIDIGAHTGQFACEIHALLPQAQLYAFEPLPDCFNELAQHIACMPKAKAYNVGLGSRAGRFELRRSEYAPSSSFRPMTDLHKKVFPFTNEMDQTVPLPVRPLDDYQAEMELPDKLLVKIDVQGYEDEVLRGGQAVISQAHLVIVEVSLQPLYEGAPSFEQIMALLGHWGFQFRGCLQQLYSPLDGSILQCDALFMKLGKDTAST